MTTDLEKFLQSKEFEFRWSTLERATQSRRSALVRFALFCSVTAAALLTHLHATHERHEQVDAAQKQLDAARSRLNKQRLNERKAEAAYAHGRSSVVVTKVKLQGLEARLRFRDSERGLRSDVRSQLDQRIRSAEASVLAAQESYSLAKHAHDAFRDKFWKTTDVAESVPGIGPYKAKVRQATVDLEHAKQELGDMVAKRDALYGTDGISTGPPDVYRALYEQLEKDVKAEVSTKASYDLAVKQAKESQDQLHQAKKRMADVKKVPDHFTLPFVGSSVPYDWFFGLGSILLLFAYGETLFHGHAQTGYARALMTHAVANGRDAELACLLPKWQCLSAGTKPQQLLALVPDLLALVLMFAVMILAVLDGYGWPLTGAVAATLMCGTRMWAAVPR